MVALNWFFQLLYHFDVKNKTIYSLKYIYKKKILYTQLKIGRGEGRGQRNLSE